MASVTRKAWVTRGLAPGRRLPSFPDSREPRPPPSLSRLRPPPPGRAVFPKDRRPQGAWLARAGAAPTGQCGESPWSLLGSRHPKPGLQPQAGCLPAPRVSFAYRCLFWRLLGSESPPEGNLWLRGLVTPETLNSSGRPAHGGPPPAGGGDKLYLLSSLQGTVPERRPRSWPGPALSGRHLGGSVPCGLPLQLKTEIINILYFSHNLFGFLSP